MELEKNKNKLENTLEKFLNTECNNRRREGPSLYETFKEDEKVEALLDAADDLIIKLQTRIFELDVHSQSIFDSMIKGQTTSRRQKKSIKLSKPTVKSCASRDERKEETSSDSSLSTSSVYSDSDQSDSSSRSEKTSDNQDGHSNSEESSDQ